MNSESFPTLHFSLLVYAKRVLLQYISVLLVYTSLKATFCSALMLETVELIRFNLFFKNGARIFSNDVNLQILSASYFIRRV